MSKTITKYRWKAFLRATAASLTCACVMASLMAVRSVRFSCFHGERVFYTQSASSQGLQKTRLRFCDLGLVRGESVAIYIKEEEGEEIALQILERHQAKLLWQEQAGEICSYYAYTPLWADGIVVNGRYVNLHIAVSKSEGRCVIGYPIIFGGF